MTSVADTLVRYAAYVSAGDVRGIVSLYAPDASIEIPVGGGVYQGIEAIRAFYTDNKLAEKLEIVGPICVAGREAAAPMRAHVARDGRILEVNIIDVVAVDDEGRLTRLRAFFDLAGARPFD